MKNAIQNSSKISEEFYCANCDYRCSRIGDYNKHIKSKKHNATKCYINATKNSLNCVHCGKTYKHHSSFYRHKKSCNDSINITNNVEMNEKTQIEELDYKEMFLTMMKKNDELQTTLLEVLPRVGNITNNNQCINNKFNLNVYLNETCKDAMNIMDFVNSLTVQLNEVEIFGSSGYVEGISKIFIRGLKELDATKRPIHCSDAKRETMYVKDNDTWVKENAERTRLKDAIKKIANKNVHRITDWTKENPASLNDYASKKHSQYMYILNKSMGACDPEENEKDYNKIIRKIATHIIIDR
jgi:hypothetical protein